MIYKGGLFLKHKQQYHKNLADTVIKNLKKRGMDGFYCLTKQEALDKALSFLDDNALISWGGSMSLSEIGLLEALKKGPYKVLDRYTATTDEESLELQRKAFFSNFYFLSANAITMDGMLYNIDGAGNRVAAMIYGPKEVIIIAGINKVCLDGDEALKRIRNVAAPTNTLRLNQNTPCTKLGKCAQCLVPDTICSHTVITRNSKPAGRIKVILVGETLGY